MDWLLFIDLLVLGLGFLVFIHSFILNVLVKPIHEGMRQAMENEVKA